jgi:phenylacetic acid degradation operon negative regulatory protein
VERFQDAIRVSSTEAMNVHPDLTLDGAVMGASGIEQGSIIQEQATDLLARTLALPTAQVLATGDERTALRGAFPNHAGIVVISGTGMICLGRNDQGVEHRCGGWGWLLDGAGSAFDIGHQGLQLTLQMADRRRPDHPLRNQIWTALDCRTSADVKARVVQPDFGAADFAALAPLVAAAAVQDLAEAHCILERSALALATSIRTVAVKLQLDRPNLVGHGGALEHLDGFSSLVKTAVETVLPSSRWMPAAGDACHGALVMAQERIVKQR